MGAPILVNVVHVLMTLMWTYHRMTAGTRAMAPTPTPAFLTPLFAKLMAPKRDPGINVSQWMRQATTWGRRASGTMISAGIRKIRAITVLEEAAVRTGIRSHIDATGVMKEVRRIRYACAPRAATTA